MNTTGMKRIGDIAKPVIVNGPYGENVPVYSLSKTPGLFDFDMVIKGFKTLEGENGPYVHILAQSVTGIGPEGETSDIAVSTGARSIIGKLDQVKTEDFPFLGRFVAGKGRGSNVWYDLE